MCENEFSHISLYYCYTFLLHPCSRAVVSCLIQHWLHFVLYYPVPLALHNLASTQWLWISAYHMCKPAGFNVCLSTMHWHHYGQRVWQGGYNRFGGIVRGHKQSVTETLIIDNDVKIKTTYQWSGRFWRRMVLSSILATKPNMRKQFALLYVQIATIIKHLRIFKNYPIYNLLINFCLVIIIICTTRIIRCRLLY